MAKDAPKRDQACNGKYKINNLSDLIALEISTLEGVVNEETDLKKASVIFTGARTVTASLKVGLEAMKLGMKRVSGVDIEGMAKITEGHQE